MKKIILISVVTSGMLFATTVNNIANTQSTSTAGSSISSSAEVTQADMKIDSWGATSDVNNLKLEGSSTISGGSNIGNASSSTVYVDQGTIDIENSTIANLRLKSTNSINNATINDSTDNFASVSQGTFRANDSNGTDADATNIDIESINSISDSNLHGGEIQQSDTLLEGGATVSGLKLVQNNDIHSGTTLNDTNVYQAKTVISGGSTLSNLESGTMNQLANVHSSNLSQLSQNSISITDGSTASNIKTDASNTIASTSTDYSFIHQNNISVMDNSQLSNLEQSKFNIITDVHASGETVIEQNNINIGSSSDVQNINNSGSSTGIDNYMQNFNITNGSAVYQNNIDIDEATVNNLNTAEVNHINGTAQDNALLAQGNIKIY